MVLFGSLLLDELFEESDEVFLEGRENTLSVLGSSFVFLNLLHAHWNAAGTSLGVMVVDETLAEGLFQSQGLWELLNEHLQIFFTARIGRVVDEHDALDVLLNWSPTLLILKITANVPKLDMNLSELRDALWWIPLKVDNSAADGGSVSAAESFLKIAQNVGDGRLATLLWSKD